LSTISRVIAVCCLLLASAVATAASTAAPVILVFGDSLSASYGLRPGVGWVDLLSQKLSREGYGFRVVNASVSGETSEGGLARLPRALQTHKPQVVVLELGANDGLRALPIAALRSNLERMIQLSLKSKARVLLLAVRLPPNYGARYNSQFELVCTQLAKQYKVSVVPWFMRDVADHAALMQADGLHPSEQGQPALLNNVWPVLSKLLVPDHNKR
jgi:acyl-CoA thioesterase-1